MKKKMRMMGIALVLALVASLCFGGIALADDPDEVVVTWVGTGLIDGSVDTGDAVACFHSEGNNHVGTFTATDLNNNPYSYGVDTNAFTMDTSIAGGGYACLDVVRTNSKTSMYGPSGQRSYTYVWTDDGDATLQNRSTTNFAQMTDSNYGWHANNHITVTGASNYALQRFVDSGLVDFAGLLVVGSGDANLSCMSSGTSGCWATKLGCGCGCYTNASFDATGSGTFNLSATGDTSATTAMMPGMTGASSFNLIASWVNSISIADYSVTVN